MSSAAGRRRSSRFPLRINSRQSHSGTSDNRSDCDSRGSGTSVYGSDDELQFYDCDEDAGGLDERHANYTLTSKDFERNFLVPISLADVAAANAGMSGRNTHRGNGGAFGMPLGLLGVNNRPLTTPEKLRLLYADHGIDLTHSNMRYSPSARNRGQWPTGQSGSQSNPAVSNFPYLLLFSPFLIYCCFLLSLSTAVFSFVLTYCLQALLQLLLRAPIPTSPIVLLLLLLLTTTPTSHIYL